MKKILITGENSYIGKSFVDYIDNNFEGQYDIGVISLRDDFWKEADFSSYDTLIHTVGIAHIKETKENQDLYYKVNRDLTYEVAKKSKQDGIKQFIFLSTMSVYGLENGVIDEHTPLKPTNNYGKSKLQAEELIKDLENEIFKVAILRPPMVYGKGCKGNYSRLAKLAKLTPIFPSVDNRRSMIYIDNLSELIRLLIDNKGNGLFLPQNNEYVNTSEIVRLIAEANGKKIITIKIFNFILRMLNVSVVNKVFGSLVYNKDLSEYYMDYKIYEFKESVFITENVKVGLIK